MEAEQSIDHLIKCHRSENNHILEVEYDDVIVEGNRVSKMFDMMDQVSSGERIRKLMIMGEHTEITKEARNLIVKENSRRKNKIIAEAIVVHNFAQKLHANFYMVLSRHIFPIRYFTDRVQAESWLKSYS